ncbi:hypothetical protein MA16_Dca006476 [Dendrobium catenatum]|uniref:Uncharacterized protein n=1 Tax=Dendrobium catenatum TaxID=906689 RepID=A0A2I0X7Z6_9ASPA|nr:hypothetical protein MA16_Dca006476 [Dendrobium catenatum]
MGSPLIARSLDGRQSPDISPTYGKALREEGDLQSFLQREAETIVNEENDRCLVNKVLLDVSLNETNVTSLLLTSDPSRASLPLQLNGEPFIEVSVLLISNEQLKVHLKDNVKGSILDQNDWLEDFSSSYGEDSGDSGPKVLGVIVGVSCFSGGDSVLDVAYLVWCLDNNEAAFGFLMLVVACWQPWCPDGLVGTLACLTNEWPLPS